MPTWAWAKSLSFRESGIWRSSIPAPPAGFSQLRRRPQSRCVGHDQDARLQRSRAEQTLEHARLAVAAADPKDGDFRTTLALAEYRAGHWASRSRADKGDASTGSSSAMAHWQNAEKDESRKWFDKAVGCTKEKAPKNVELLQFWLEAAELLGQPNPGLHSGTVPAEARPGALPAKSDLLLGRRPGDTLSSSS